MSVQGQLGAWLLLFHSTICSRIDFPHHSSPQYNGGTLPLLVPGPIALGMVVYY